MGARNRGGIGLSYRPARLHRLAKLIPWNGFLSSCNVYNVLCTLNIAFLTNRSLIIHILCCPSFKGFPWLSARFALSLCHRFALSLCQVYPVSLSGFVLSLSETCPVSLPGLSCSSARFFRSICQFFPCFSSRVAATSL
jgi:hypothetical protein